MGVKNIKEHYRISHIVHLRHGSLCIGSPYILDIISLCPKTGRLLKGYDGRSNDDLPRYQEEICRAPAKFLELLNAPDTHTASIPVWTYQGNQIIEQQCETPGWPHTTHSGQLMHVNTHFPTAQEAAAEAKKQIRAGIWLDTRRLEEFETGAATLKQDLAEAQQDLAALLAVYPDPPPTENSAPPTADRPPATENREP